MSTLNKENFYEIDEGDSNDEIEEVAMIDSKRRQMKQTMNKVVKFLKKVDKSIKRVLVPHNLIMLGLSANWHVASV